jgi:methylenetetrahydrofolate--tRNA-(uracil-5-)-methyltransferase
MLQDNVGATLFNLVGFQTNLTYPEQRRVFRMIPGLENAEFVRYGLMHRNSYIKAPIVLKNTLQMKKHATLLIAGQLTGVEGYVESAAMGLLAAINAKRIFLTQAPVTPPISTMIGSLVHYITNCSPDAFAPMNANFGILYGSNKNHRLEDADRAINSLKEWLDELQ